MINGIKDDRIKTDNVYRATYITKTGKRFELYKNVSSKFCGWRNVDLGSGDDDYRTNQDEGLLEQIGE